MPRFRAALPHQLDGRAPTEADLPLYIERVDELEAEVDHLRSLLAEVNRQDRVQLRRALEADVRANIDRLRQELRRAEEKKN
jgi:hypothetical protein